MSIDWSKPETLRFRNFDAKIIEVIYPKDERCQNMDYPVKVFYENSDGEISETNVGYDGYFYKDKEENFKDIVQTKKVPLTFWEIVKLIHDNEGLMVDDGYFKDNVCEIDIENQTFTFGISNYDCEFLAKNFAYTLDGETWHKFEKDEE